MDSTQNPATPNSRGTLTTPKPGGGTQELEIIDFLKARYADDRLISIMGIEDDSVAILIENPPTSGRSNSNQMWLTKESLLGLLTTTLLYFSAKGENLHELVMGAAVEGGQISYTYSDNLKQVDESDFTVPSQA